MSPRPAGTNERCDDRSDSQLVARLVVKYYDWLTDNGGVPPEELLALPLSQRQRRQLLDRMDDVLTIYGLTADCRRGPCAGLLFQY
jgi:hypothetical protein